MAFLRTSSALFFIAAASLGACRPKDSSSDPNAVWTSNTSIKQQGVVGFCWAYAAVAMIESRYLAQTGKEIDLSEEAVGYFHLAEKLQSLMDTKLKEGKIDSVLYVDPATKKEHTIAHGSLEGSVINQGWTGSKGAFALIERWGLIPESQWTVKFEDSLDIEISRESLDEEFVELRKRIDGKQRVVQMNQIFEVLNSGTFSKTPPVDAFDNGSGRMNAVQYAKNVIRFNPKDYYDVFINSSNKGTLPQAIEDVKRSLARGQVVGLAVSMPAADQQRLVSNQFVGFGRPFEIRGGHSMVITDFRNAGGTFGPSDKLDQEMKTPLGPGFQLRLKNSWGSRSGFNEFGQKVTTGFYDMYIGYLEDVLSSPNGFVILTFARE